MPLVVLIRRLGVKSSLYILWLSNCHVHIVVGGLIVPFLNQDSVNITSCASKDIVLLGDVAGIARQVLLFVFDIHHSLSS